MLEVDIIENFAALRELRPVWNPLLAKAWSKSVFLTWEWSAVERLFTNRCQ